MGVYIGAIKDDYSAMQGPAPSGFHVPLNTEWQAVYNVWIALGGGSSAGTNFGIALKLPFAGRRSYASSNVVKQGTNGCYWSSSRYNTNNAYSLNLDATALNPQSADGRASGLSVRCFKNTPTIPTSSWTKLYGTSIEAGGIFWNSTDGLISMSSDGTTWITIADKNLGATTVWNSGDTLSETNCGKYYQRGNNYGFPFTGSVTTSSTQVDASTYGPGNYYSSSTFITRGSSPYRWDTTDNGNLRGGTTGVKPASLKNAYIGEGIWNMEDNFTGTSLNTDLWTATNYGGATASYTVNNGLFLSKTVGRGGYAVYTKKTFEGTESKITIECSISAEGGDYRESQYDILGITHWVDANNNPYTPNNYPFAYCRSSTYDSKFEAQFRNGETTVGNFDTLANIPATPYTIKYVIDVNNWTAEIYLNGVLVKSATSLYSTKAKAIGQPYFSICCISWTNVSCTISNVKIAVEY